MTISIKLQMNEKSYSLDDAAVVGHIDMLQGIIGRMSSNCSNCKTWAVTVVAAILALSDYSGWQRFWICCGPIVLFFFIDSFYLGLERRFICLQQMFIADINDGMHVIPYTIESTTAKEQLTGMLKGFISLSTTPFYILLVIIL